MGDDKDFVIKPNQYRVKVGKKDGDIVIGERKQMDERTLPETKDGYIIIEEQKQMDKKKQKEDEVVPD